ncbi:hypothetical protein TCAL_02638 [Tigriopus californicus]|uniref:Uncharacterized protein n=1 Tax=Tigriopus californicus TaxID=6832 RepID=A0A553NG05_TIGCA|nr:hypothetical protein TCAL_02638 [Tigriopus californicus]|eukprot:TCALIF_02638-PA protein Name:"Protein of unknown function" AED:0.00 eAED:0.00 QI:64/1/1/1/1/1/2/517/131
MACFPKAWQRLRQWYWDLCGLPDVKATGQPGLSQGHPQQSGLEGVERPFVSPPPTYSASQGDVLVKSIVDSCLEAKRTMRATDWNRTMATIPAALAAIRPASSSHASETPSSSPLCSHEGACHGVNDSPNH